jgi:uncharacterized protein (DUF427 family)
MSLTLGSGPLGGRPPDSNYTLQSPAHKILFEPDGRRLRALVGDTVVLDTTGAHLLHETGIRPVPYVPLADIDPDLLERTDTVTHCPFKGDASYWSLRVGDDVRVDAVWAYEEPLETAPWLRGFAALYADRVDRWLVEDEPLAGHLRDPYHRVDVHQSSRAVRISVGDDLIAETKRPVLLFETSLPVRAYVPRGDVVAGHLAPSPTQTTCPYKGDATYWHVHAGGRTFPDAAWSVELPLAAAMKIAGHVCFAADGITVDIEGS